MASTPRCVSRLERELPQRICECVFIREVCLGSRSSHHLNRSVHEAVVAIELFPKDQWTNRVMKS